MINLTKIKKKCLDDFLRAKQKLKQAIELSETEDINSEKDEYYSKYKRKKLAAKKAKRLIEFSPVDNKSTANKFKVISQTLPKHQFIQLPGKKIS